MEYKELINKCKEAIKQFDMENNHFKNVEIHINFDTNNEDYTGFWGKQNLRRDLNEFLCCNDFLVYDLYELLGCRSDFKINIEIKDK